MSVLAENLMSDSSNILGRCKQHQRQNLRAFSQGVLDFQSIITVVCEQYKRCGC